MSLESIIAEKIANLEDLPDEFIDVVDSQNNLLFKQILKLLDQMDIEGGVILSTEKNIGIATQVNELLKKTLFESEYLQGLKEFIGSFSDQALLINSIYSEQFDFSEKSIYKSLITQSQKSTLEFLDDDAIGKAVFEPLQKNILTNIYSGAKYSDMVISIKEYILGGEGIDPKLTSYVKRYARDSMAIFDNTYTQLISQDVEVELWEYSGGTLKDSRDFCLERNGNVYTREEIESWADKDWQGKNPATDSATIFAYRGGYNCIHSFIPRDPNFVEKEEINIYN
jgi:hypothetical protein